MTVALVLLLFVLAGTLTLASYVERIYAEMGKFLSREFADNIESYEQSVEPRLGEGARVQLCMALVAQFSIAGIAVVLSYLVFVHAAWAWLDVVQISITLVFAVILFNRLLPFVLFTRTEGRWLIRFVPLLRLMIWLVIVPALVLGFSQSVAALAEEEETEPEETTSEAVEALIEAGQEEGILSEQSDRELIQSAVEFGEKTVREVMTPRPEITAVPAGTNIAEFTELLRSRPYSRVPVYEGTIDNIRGIVFAHDVLQVADTEAPKRTVAEMMRPVQFVPESKRVQQLLREMQRENIHMAAVIDEYGGVAGLVTIEDLVEEIVGEIRDEHEAEADIVKETDSSYIVPGNMDIDRLNVLFGTRPEDYEATTVGGLVSEIAGRIPRSGEILENDGLRFEVLDSTDRRVERLRISSFKPAEQIGA